MFPVVTERRNHNKELLEAMEAFEPASPDLIEGTCGNVQSEFDPSYDADESGKYAYRGGIFSDAKPFYEIVSAPYVLAKLAASYPGLQISTEGQEGYKVTWTVVLKHKESGHVITFYDWKGAASYGSDLRSKLPPGFKEAVKALLLALADPQFPHPYDGCVIGEIA
jgi:hypothetical protein